ncbi:S8 family serine peptidase [Actinoplanes sp. KI2]|uniref:S8 family serine peptidase n=1 Tax=Actinoplanes sp. KI2 TaxID=2983315 RepID=UPI0021D60EAD|nr:S8 family serine peptidase [Actinoplanes sp. KI2]MCU7726921.1 S8 family serine peptidase [Actinoplanes sp. KI2]
MRRRRLHAVMLVTTLGVAGLSAPAAAAPAGSGTAAGTTAGAAAPPGTTTSVTLITGDRVTVHGRNISVTRGPGRANIRFLREAIGGHQYVIPSDALALLQAGKVDKRLFDLSQLGGRSDLRLLVGYGRSSAAETRSALAAGGARVTRDIPAVGTLAVRADVTQRVSLWRALTAGAGERRVLGHGVQRVWLDGRRRISLDHSVPQIGAPAAWQAGYDGRGVTVAILDTGIDQTHPDLAGQIAGTENFTDSPTVDDEVGHGTHVASIIAGTGAASGGRYKGVAPGAKLLIGKVCSTEFCDDSAILAGMAWAAARAPVINMSLGGTDTPDIDPLEQAVGDLTRQYDTLFVIAAGNDGGKGTVGSPSTADDALSVGAVDREDQLAPFSSRGPRTGDHALKPDITAPGVDIVAAKAAHGTIGDPAPVAGYVALSGTSMATPHVAGSAAILTQEHPGWSSRLRKNTLMGSAKPTDGVNAFDQGAGRVDVAREITQTITADQGSLSFGLQAWPHTDDQPVVRPITYRNSGTSAVNLTIAAPAAPFSVADTHLTVPAGGTASTTVTANTRTDAVPDGPIGGYLTATAAGGARVQTPIGVDKEVESYDVSVAFTNRDGTPNSEHFMGLFNLDTFESFDVMGTDAVVKLRLPKGRYGAFAWIDHGKTDASMVVASQIEVNKALTIPADARKAAPVRVKPPQAGAGTLLAAVDGEWSAPAFGISASLLGDDFSTLYAGRINEASSSIFVGGVTGSFADPGAAGTYRNSPYTVDLAYFSPGRMFHGLVRSPRLRELATLRTTFAAEASGAEGVKGNMAQYTENSGGWMTFVPFDLPFRRTEYLNTEAPWSGEFMQQSPAVGDDFPAILSDNVSGRTPRHAGRVYQENWNAPVFGPNVTQPPYSGLWATRDGDHLIAVVPMFGDGGGHPGGSTVDADTVELYRDGTKVGEGTDYDLPPGAANYRLTATSTRGAPHTLATSVSGVWTFRSGHTAEAARLPLTTVRFSPRLDAANSAPGGRLFDVPLTVERQPGSAAGAVRSLRVEVSFDDGRTWRPALVCGIGDHRVATVLNPRAKGFASLRVTAADTKGNTVTQTVIRAYAVR